MSKADPWQRSAFPAFRSMTTRWSDNDMYGHMNNVIHYHLFDTAINQWLLEADILSFTRRDVMFVVAETGCSYFREMAYPDRVTAGLRIARLGTASVRYEVGLFRNDETAASAQGHFVHVHVDPQTRRPTPIAPDQRERLGILVVV